MDITVTEAASAAPAHARKTATPIIDCDVHPLIVGGIGAVFPYLSNAWQRRLEALQSAEILATPVGRATHWAKSGGNRSDSLPPGGGPGGSDPVFLGQHHLDAHNIEIAILLSIQASRVDSFTNADDAAALASAYNNYFAAEWLPADSRFRLGMVVAPQDPLLAAKEIRRFGRNPGVVGVWIPLINTLLGNRYFNPIYEAAHELNLPIIVHTNGTQGDFVGSPLFAGGNPSSKAEKLSQVSELGISNVVSLVFEGVFEKYKELKVIFVENGWTWVAPLMWRMDAIWRSGRKSVPWVHAAPSEYVLQNIRFSTQPALEVPSKKYLLQIIEMMSGERTLLFSSDYPHWDADDPEFPFRGLPEPVLRRIMHDNAVEAFGPRLLEKPS